MSAAQHSFGPACAACEGHCLQRVPVANASVAINLHIGQHVRHCDYQGKRVTGVVHLLSHTSDQGLICEIGLDEPIVIPASDDLHEIRIYRQYAPAHEFQPFDERDQLIAELLATLTKADQDFDQEGFGEGGPYRAPIRAAIAKARGVKS